MPESSVIVATRNAGRYLQQLCKHWSHRFTVEFTPEHGRIALADDRTVLLDATDAGLAVRIHASSQAELSRLEKVVEEHILRFAFREELDFKWTNEGIGA